MGSGPAASKAVDQGQHSLFPEYDIEDEEKRKKENAALWYLFVYINGEYTQIGPGYSPKLIDDKPFDDLYNELMSGQKTDATNAINAEAANITRLICSASGGQPEAACK